MMRSGETPVLALAVAFAFLSVIPFGNLLLLLRLLLSLLLLSPFWLSSRRDLLLLLSLLLLSPFFRSFPWESASSPALPLPFFLSFPLGICFLLLPLLLLLLLSLR